MAKVITNGSHCLIEEYEDVSEEESEDAEVELVVQGRTISVNESLLCQQSGYFRQILCDCDKDQETIVLQQLQDGRGRQEEPLSRITFITMTSIVEFIYSGRLTVHDQNVGPLLAAAELLLLPAVQAECFAYLKR